MNQKSNTILYRQFILTLIDPDNWKVYKTKVGITDELYNRLDNVEDYLLTIGGKDVSILDGEPKDYKVVKVKELKDVKRVHVDKKITAYITIVCTHSKDNPCLYFEKSNTTDMFSGCCKYTDPLERDSMCFNDEVKRELITKCYNEMTEELKDEEKEL